MKLLQTDECEQHQTKGFIRQEIIIKVCMVNHEKGTLPKFRGNYCSVR